MYIVKNAFRNMVRNKGKNILIGVIITVIAVCTCIALAIHKAGDNLVNTYKESNPLAISFNLDMRNLRDASDDVRTNFQSLTVEDVKKYADSDFVKDYYYTLEASVNSTTIEAIVDNERPSDVPQSEDNHRMDMGDRGQMFSNIGDFRITAYSNFAYLTEFSDGTKKISDGEMITGSSDSDEITISKDLAEENDLNVGDEVTFSLTSDESVTFTFKIVGIYEDNSTDESSSFMQMNVMNSSNQIYTNTSSLEKILNAQGEDDTKLVASNGLTAKFYLTSNDKLENFEAEVRNKGLSEYYSVTTNESEILQTLQPIQNISSFSMNFLIVILVIGIVVLAVINFLNIRDRKYEIGVLRAIGMSKVKTTLQLVLEIFFVAMVSLVLGTGLGYVLSQPVTNKMLESEIESYTNKTNEVEANFGRGDMMRPSEAMGGRNNMPGGRENNIAKNPGNIDYVSSLKVSIDIITILELFAVCILLTVTSGVVASIFVNKYNPNKILQNRV